MVKFFSFKSAWIFPCAFQLSSKPFPCIFLACLHFVSKKNKDKIIYIENNERNKAEQEHFSQKKDTGQCFSAKLKSTWKTSGTIEGKKNNLPEKITYVPLAPSHSIEGHYGCFRHWFVWIHNILLSAFFLCINYNCRTQRLLCMTEILMCEDAVNK